MANYLEGLSSQNQNYSGSSSSAAISRGIAAVASAINGGGLGVGSKPKALHTEYASGEANWQKPYGSSTDIVFYIKRAG